jgi:hypothetical protein
MAATPQAAARVPSEFRWAGNQVHTKKRSFTQRRAHAPHLMTNQVGVKDGFRDQSGIPFDKYSPFPTLP